jgi:hypothetical protein
MLCKLAEQNHVRVTGNEHTGSFSCRGVEGDYEFGEDDIHGKFASHGVVGEFSFDIAEGVTTAGNSDPCDLWIVIAYASATSSSSPKS